MSKDLEVIEQVEIVREYDEHGNVIKETRTVLRPAPVETPVTPVVPYVPAPRVERAERVKRGAYVKNEVAAAYGYMDGAPCLWGVNLDYHPANFD